MKKSGLLIWAFLRLPILAGGFYLFRSQIFAYVNDNFNLGTIIDFAVFSASTFWTRCILYLAIVLVLIFVYWLLKKWVESELSRYGFFLIGAFIAVYFSFSSLLLAPSSLFRTCWVILILAINTLPLRWIPSGGLINFFFITGVGWCEAFFPQAYFFWLIEDLRPDSLFKKSSWLCGVIIAPLLMMFLLTPYDNQRVLTFGEVLHADPAVEKFAEGNYNWIEFNAERRLLYAVGRATKYLLAFDVEHLDQAPRRSEMNIGKMQSFAFNPDLQELYIYRADTHELLYLDAWTLETFRTIPVIDLSPGDVWVNWQPGTDSITVASEADMEIDTPFVMIDRASGGTIAVIPQPLIPTNVTFDLEKDILYFSSFRDTYLISWDMNSHEVLRRTETSPRTDRLVYFPAASEILIASPQEGAILRYDAATLEYRGKIQASIGDRTLTIDPQRNLLLVGNFINNTMQVIDLKTYETVDSFYIGPWIRTIALDVEAGIAYVSTVHNLFKVEYALQE